MKILKICLLSIGSFILAPMFLSAEHERSPEDDAQEGVKITMEPGCYMFSNSRKEFIICREEAFEVAPLYLWRYKVMPVDPQDIESFDELSESAPTTFSEDGR